MFEIKSYISVPENKVLDLSFVEQHPELYFINIEEKENLLDLTTRLDFSYLSGAICLDYYGTRLIGYREWDLIDQLWAYILNVIEEFLQTGHGSTYFPDQPLRMELKKIAKDSVLFLLGEGSISRCILPRYELLDSLTKGAKIFFKTMNETFQTRCDYTSELNRIEEIRKKI